MEQVLKYCRDPPPVPFQFGEKTVAVVETTATSKDQALLRPGRQGMGLLLLNNLNAVLNGA